MDKVYLSISLCSFQFISFMSYSFQCRDLSLPWLIYSQVFYCCQCYWKQDCLFSDSSLLVYRNATDYYMLTWYPQTFVVHLLSHVQFFVTPWTAAHQPSLSFTICQSLLKLMTFELMMLSLDLLNSFISSNRFLMVFSVLLCLYSYKMNKFWGSNIQNSDYSY